MYEKQLSTQIQTSVLVDVIFNRLAKFYKNKRFSDIAQQNLQNSKVDHVSFK